LHVFVTAKTRYGKARIRLTKNQWEAANATPARSQSRSHIAIKVKQRLKGAGARLDWLNWDEIYFYDVSQRGPESVELSSPLDNFNAQVQQGLEWAEEQADIQAAAELFPDFFDYTPAVYRGDQGCGCVPSRVTER